MYKRITKKQSSIARQRANKILRDVQKVLKNEYKFAKRLVGSGAWGTMIEDENGEYDLDYQILLTKNSKVYKENGFNDPTQIKRDFISAFDKSLNKNEKTEDSTTAITLINTDDKPYHIDFVIIRIYPKNHEIIRRNNKRETPTINENTWNKLPQWNEAYDYFKSLPVNEKQHLIEDIIIPKKQKEKAKPENDSTKISSAALFVREVNNYRCQQQKK